MPAGLHRHCASTAGLLVILQLPTPLRIAPLHPAPPTTHCAGAHPIDIRNALKGHPLADQMADIIGPEPEPEAEAAEAAAPEAEAAEAEAPKGLPALGPKPGKKKEGGS